MWVYLSIWKGAFKAEDTVVNGGLFGIITCQLI